MEINDRKRNRGREKRNIQTWLKGVKVKTRESKKNLKKNIDRINW